MYALLQILGNVLLFQLGKQSTLIFKNQSMKKIVLFLALCLTLISCTKEKVVKSEPTTEAAKGKPVKGGQALRVMSILTGVNAPSGNFLEWSYQIPSGLVVGHVAIVREFTDVSGTTYVMQPQNDSRVRVFGCFQCGATSYLEAATIPFSYSVLLSGTYKYYVTGNYIDPSNSLISIPFISNTITVTVP
jgi:hypothetical protein